MSMIHKKSIWIGNIALIFFSAMFLLPLLWLVIASFDPQATQSIRLPEHFSAENFQAILNNPKHVRGFLNSIIISGAQTVIVMFCSLLAAYPLSRFKLKHAQRITMAIVFMTSLPVLSIMVPVYQLFLIFDMVDSIFGTVMFMAASSMPYAIWMCKNFYDSVPDSLEESAAIDGASRIQSIIHVILPLMIPGIFTVGIYTFINSWGNFFVPFILLLDSGKFPAAVNIYRFFGVEGEVLYGQIAAYSLIYMTPVVILFYLAQGYMSKGFVMSGSIKG